MALRRRNKVVIWEWSPSGKHRETNRQFAITRGLTLVAAGMGFLYFGWLFSTTGIVSLRRRAVTAAEDPDRFYLAVGVIAAVGAISVIAGLVKILRR